MDVLFADYFQAVFLIVDKKSVLLAFHRGGQETKHNSCGHEVALNNINSVTL